MLQFPLETILPNIIKIGFGSKKL